MFAQNCWYVIADKDAVTSEKPIASQVAGQDIVLYRDKENKVIAMQDLCPHRLAPLSHGRIEGDEIRCMYHGLKFDTSGQCNEIPGQEKIPKAFCVKTFIVIERYEWLWVWIGDQDKIDESTLPDTYGLNPAEWTFKKNSIDYDANFHLLNDNLCDLSHIAFVHETTLGTLGGSDDWAKYKSVITNLERGVRFDRWFIDRDIMKPDGKAMKCDIWITYDYIMPGILLMETGMYPPKTAEKSEFKNPVEHTPFSKDYHAQAVTPMDDKTLRYYYTVAIPHGQPVGSLEYVFNMSSEAFLEDKKMLEGQQRVIDKNPDLKLSATVHDQASIYFRRLIEKSI